MKEGKPFRLKDRLLSFRYALQGLMYMIKHEHNARIHFLATLIVLFLSFYFKISRMEWIIVLLCISMVVSAECVNTSIEKVCDEITTDTNRNIKIAKDTAATAVLICAIAAAIIGLIIFTPYLMN